MLNAILSGSRARILALARVKTAALAKSRHAAAALEHRLPELYDDLVETVERAANPAQGKGVEGQGYGLPQAVHGYVALLQALAETAEAMGVAISPSDRRTLGRCLELAIHEAAAEYKGTSRTVTDSDETTRMGFLIHELRNALSCVFVAQSMITKAPGPSNALLERNLHNMRSMLDRASLEVRLHTQPLVHRTRMPLIEAVREVEATAGELARQNGLTLSVHVDRNLTINADRPLLVSALANLVQNALKFTKSGRTIWIRGFEKGRAVVLEVEDRCGGLPAGRIAELFKPFTQMGHDRSGLGLGLAISRRALALNGGELTARDIPGIGCVFTIALPSARALPSGGGRVAHHVTARS